MSWSTRRFGVWNYGNAWALLFDGHGVKRSRKTSRILGYVTRGQTRGAAESGKIKRKALKTWLVNVYLERKSLAHSLNDTKTAIEELNRLASGLLLLVILIVWLLLMGLLTTNILAFISSQLLLVVFVYGALRALETFSQLCTLYYGSKSVQVYRAPWYIRDSPRFAYRGLLLDTSRHYLPVDVIKQVIESMSYAKLNVLHWHIIDRESFPLKVPSYPKLWKGSYTKWERYTVEDEIEIVSFAKTRGINVMAEIDVPGHAESWGAGYPNLWPSTSCKEPLDVSKSSTFDVVSGIQSDMRKIFPFELFHLGGDEVNTSTRGQTEPQERPSRGPASSDQRYVSALDICLMSFGEARTVSARIADQADYGLLNPASLRLGYTLCRRDLPGELTDLQRN
ncbi:beta-hexosaminidase 1 [Prunus dulcis]|uniref:beta-N-acetylhexosaminidase n=1 Tax=Prunus dulcis TaxID=3755 RepID=A0A4Y1RD18_PRUDU|nr:beta-hexosaminidase 1 [Prunus dulcis]